MESTFQTVSETAIVRRSDAWPWDFLEDETSSLDDHQCVAMIGMIHLSTSQRGGGVGDVIRNMSAEREK
jgi:hypothetical protein